MADDYYQNLEVGGLRSLKDIINLGAYWRDVREDFENGKLVYRGCHYLHNAPESDDQWEIWKYTYSDGNKVREEGPLPGAWNNRAGLEWFDFNSSTTTDKVDMAEELMREILYQLKITNLHLSILTNEEITNVD